VLLTEEKNLFHVKEAIRKTYEESSFKFSNVQNEKKKLYEFLTSDNHINVL